MAKLGLPANRELTTGVDAYLVFAISGQSQAQTQRLLCVIAQSKQRGGLCTIPHRPCVLKGLVYEVSDGDNTPRQFVIN